MLEKSIKIPTILACLISGLILSTAVSFAFTCEVDHKADVTSGKSCCGEPVLGEPGFYFFKVKDSPCPQGEPSLGLTDKNDDDKDKDTDEKVCPCDKIKIE